LEKIRTEFPPSTGRKPSREGEKGEKLNFDTRQDRPLHRTNSDCQSKRSEAKGKRWAVWLKGAARNRGPQLGLHKGGDQGKSKKLQLRFPKETNANVFSGEVDQTENDSLLKEKQRPA